MGERERSSRGAGAARTASALLRHRLTKGASLLPVLVELGPLEDGHGVLCEQGRGVCTRFRHAMSFPLPRDASFPKPRLHGPHQAHRRVLLPTKEPGALCLRRGGSCLSHPAEVNLRPTTPLPPSPQRTWEEPPAHPLPLQPPFLPQTSSPKQRTWEEPPAAHPDVPRRRHVLVRVCELARHRQRQQLGVREARGVGRRDAGEDVGEWRVRRDDVVAPACGQRGEECRGRVRWGEGRVRRDDVVAPACAPRRGVVFRGPCFGHAVRSLPPCCVAGPRRRDGAQSGRRDAWNGP